MNIFKLGLAGLILAALAFTACSKENNCKSGSGGSTTRNLNLSNISSIDFQQAGEVIITQGITQAVVVTGDENVVNDIDTDVDNGVWKIDFDKHCYKNYELTIFITVPNINAVSLSGSGSITINDFTGQQNNLSLDISGSGSIFLSAFDGAQNMSVEISGSGAITASADIPTLKTLDIKISGSGNYDGFSITSDDCDINIPGSGNCKVTVNNHLDVKISGSGNVFYKGHPSITSNITGSGELIDAN
jgi:hypothetical protein